MSHSIQSWCRVALVLACGVLSGVSTQLNAQEAFEIIPITDKVVMLQAPGGGGNIGMFYGPDGV